MFTCIHRRSTCYTNILCGHCRIEHDAQQSINNSCSLPYCNTRFNRPPIGFVRSFHALICSFLNSSKRWMFYRWLARLISVGVESDPSRNGKYKSIVFQTYSNLLEFMELGLLISIEIIRIVAIVCSRASLWPPTDATRHTPPVQTVRIDRLRWNPRWFLIRFASWNEILIGWLAASDRTFKVTDKSPIGL